MAVNAPDMAARGALPPAVRWHTMAALICAYVVAFVDRQILGLLIEPMKADLGLSDTAISLLHGPAFAILLAVTGLPLGLLIDRARRTLVIAAGIAFWSLATAGCGLATGFAALVACRAAVGMGEATLTPAGHSIIADSFPRRQLGLALGIFGIGGFIGSGLALVIGAGVIASLPDGGTVSLPLLGGVRPWQLVFLVIALPGLPLALWIALRPEPPRTHGSTAPGRAETVAHFRLHGRSLMLVNLSAAFTGMAIYAIGAWGPSFLIRTHGYTAAQAGLSLGLLTIACGVTGMLGGGWLGDRLVARGRVDGRILILAVAGVGALPFAAAMLVSDARVGLALLAPPLFLNALVMGVLPSAQQAITPGRLRGLVAALGVFTVNIIGLGVGATAVALVTDQAFSDPAKLRYALAATVPVMMVFASLLALAARRPYRRSVGAAA